MYAKKFFFLVFDVKIVKSEEEESDLFKENEENHFLQ